MRLALLALLLAPACKPTCKQTCDKLTGCEQLEDWQGSYADVCAENCQRQYQLYEFWDDTQLTDALDETQLCIADATCDEIAEGVCYDEDLYSF